MESGLQWQLGQIGLVDIFRAFHPTNNTIYFKGKNVYYIALVWNALKISTKPIWTNVSLKATLSMLIFCLEYLSTDVNEVLKSLPVTVLLLIYPFMSVTIYFIYLGAPVLGA